MPDVRNQLQSNFFVLYKRHMGEKKHCKVFIKKRFIKLYIHQSERSIFRKTIQM